MRGLMLLGLVVFLAGCAVPQGGVRLTEQMSAPSRGDLLTQIRNRLSWLGPQKRWHQACLFTPITGVITIEQLRLRLSGADVLYRAHFEERRKAFQSAAQLYRQAADQAMPLAYERLGMLLIRGQGRVPNAPEGVRLLRQSAWLGCAAGQHRFADLLANGVGVTTDVVESWAWAALAQDQGYEDSSGLLRRLERVMSTPQLDFARQTFMQKRQQLQNFNQGAYGQELVTCTVPRRFERHAMGGTQEVAPFR